MAEIMNVGSRSPADQDSTQGMTARRILPATDIWEDADAVMLSVDMPGVGKDELSVEVAEHTLTLGGRIQVDLPDTLSARFAELRGSSYERQIALGEGIDTEKIEAHIRDGVLTVRLPKTAATRRRKIEIKTH